MTSRILKWTVPVDAQPHRIGGGRVVHVASQHDSRYEVQVWTLEHIGGATGRPLDDERTVKVYGTGADLPPWGIPLGTALITGGLVWHVVEIGRAEVQ